MKQHLKYIVIGALTFLLNRQTSANSSELDTLGNASPEFQTFSYDKSFEDVEATPLDLEQEDSLPPMQELLSNGSLEPLSIEEWSDKNGLDITQLFSVVVYVNKSPRGKTAQTAKVYVKGELASTYKVSTGRNQWEKSKSGVRYFTSTPLGWFSPYKFSPNHYSKMWKSPMPWAVFFNGGIALHATTKKHYEELGKPASGGCVRFRNDHAKAVYNTIYDAGVNHVPQFTQTGELLKGDDGQLVLAPNYDTLIIVAENVD